MTISAVEETQPEGAEPQPGPESEPERKSGRARNLLLVLLAIGLIASLAANYTLYQRQEALEGVTARALADAEAAEARALAASAERSALQDDANRARGQVARMQAALGALREAVARVEAIAAEPAGAGDASDRGDAGEAESSGSSPGSDGAARTPDARPERVRELLGVQDPAPAASQARAEPTEPAEPAAAESAAPTLLDRASAAVDRAGDRVGEALERSRAFFSDAAGGGAEADATEAAPAER